MEEPELKSRPRVFVIHQQPLDFTPAAVFGDVQFMNSVRLAPAPPPGAVDVHNKGVLAAIRKDLAGYIPGLDYIVPTGSPIKIILVGMVLKEKGPSHKVLGWDAKSQRYMEYILEV